MPRVADLPSHRIHIRLDLDDYEWLRDMVGDEKLISETIRILIKNLRKNCEGRNPETENILEDEDTDT